MAKIYGPPDAILSTFHLKTTRSLLPQALKSCHWGPCSLSGRVQDPPGLRQTGSFISTQERGLAPIWDLKTFYRKTACGYNHLTFFPSNHTKARAQKVTAWKLYFFFDNTNISYALGFPFLFSPVCVS